MSIADGFATPEEAALAGWRSTPAALARVRSVTVRRGRAEVLIETSQTGPDHVDYIYCVQGGNGRWRETVSGNAPTPRWDDPAEYDWIF